MASNGLLKRAKTGTCCVCVRRRCTDKHVKAVGVVKRGYAVGHIWRCKDSTECVKTAKKRVEENHPKADIIKIALDPKNGWL